MSKDTPRGPGEIQENVQDQPVVGTSTDVEETAMSTRSILEAVGQFHFDEVMKKDMPVPRAANSDTLLRLVAPVIDLNKYKMRRKKNARAGRRVRPKLRLVAGSNREVNNPGGLEKVRSKKLLQIALLIQQELESMRERKLSDERVLASLNILINLRRQDFFVCGDEATFFQETAKILLRLFNRYWRFYLNDRCVQDMMYKIREDELIAPKLSLIYSWIRGSS